MCIIGAVQCSAVHMCARRENGTFGRLGTSSSRWGEEAQCFEMYHAVLHKSSRLRWGLASTVSARGKRRDSTLGLHTTRPVLEETIDS